MRVLKTLMVSMFLGFKNPKISIFKGFKKSIV